MDYSKDYYSVLGVGKDASDSEISSAYKRLMKKWHPDLFASKSKEEQDEATRQSSEINEAYGVLSDKNKREEYDMYRSARNGFSYVYSSFRPSDDSIFKRPKPERKAEKGVPITKTVELPFEDFFFGCKKTCTLNVLKHCEHCNNGIVGEEEEWGVCGNCNGSGIEYFLYGNSFIRQTCSKCGGYGRTLTNKCMHCDGSGIDMHSRRIQTMDFVIPPRTNELYWRQTYVAAGNAGIYGGDNGDVTITATASATASQNGLFFPNGGPQRLCTIHHINIFKAIAGGLEAIPTPYGMKTVMLPSMLKDGQTIKYSDAGLKDLKRFDGSTYDGDLYVTFKYELPTKMDDDDLDRFMNLAKIYDDEPSKFANISAQKERENEYLKRFST